MGVDPSKDKVKDKLGVAEEDLKKDLAPAAQRERSKTLAPTSTSEIDNNNNPTNPAEPVRRLSIEVWKRFYFLNVVEPASKDFRRFKHERRNC